MLSNTGLHLREKNLVERILLLLQKEKHIKSILGIYILLIAEITVLIYPTYIVLKPVKRGFFVWGVLFCFWVLCLFSLSFPLFHLPLHLSNPSVLSTKELGKSWEEVQLEDDRELLDHQEE